MENWPDQRSKFLKSLATVMTVIMFLKIGGYFTIVEDRGITQVLKIILRMGMTGYITFIMMKFKSLFVVFPVQLKHFLSFYLYLAYLSLGFLSFMWSTNVAFSAIQWIMAVESLVFCYLFISVVAVANWYQPEKPIYLDTVFANAIFYIMAIILIGTCIDPDTFFREMRGGDEIRLGGYLMNPNELGMLGAIGASMSFIVYQREKKKWFIFTMLTSITALALTTSRSSMIGFILIMGILAVMSKNQTVILSMIVGMVLGVPFILQYVIFKEGGGVEEVMSMTGRLPFWTALLNEGIVREPFFGYGFMRINYIEFFQGVHTYPGQMTHNTFMQVLMNLGFVGFFIAFWQLVTTLRLWVMQRNTSPYYIFFIAMFIPVVINSFTEFGIFGEANYGILFYQFLLVLFSLSVEDKLTRIDINIFNKVKPDTTSPLPNLYNKQSS